MTLEVEKIAYTKEKTLNKVININKIELKKFFNIIIKEWSHDMLRGRTYNFMQNSNTLQSILLNHYNRVFKKFHKHYRRNLNNFLTDNSKHNLVLDKESDKDVTKRTQLHYSLLTEKRAKDVSLVLLLTFEQRVTNRYMKHLHNIQFNSTQTKDYDSDNSDAIMLTLKSVSATNEGQADLLANQEGRERTEDLNQIEGQETEDHYKRNNLALINSKKMWQTMEDNRVRDYTNHSHFSHREANKQVKDFLEPFEVSGEKLMYPKDKSLGASLGNIIRCRCMSVPLFDVDNVVLYDATHN